MSGKGAHPFHSAWLAEGTSGELPGDLLQNHLFPGRPEDMSDDELREAHGAGFVSFLVRRAQILVRLAELRGNGIVHGLIHQTAQLDSAIVNAETALRNAGADPRSQLRWFEKFDPASPAIPDLQAAVPSYAALEQDCFTARAANSTLAALEAEARALEQERDALSESLDERFVRQASNELRRRGKPLRPDPV